MHIKIVNVYIIYNLYYWSKKSSQKLYIENCLFGATNIVKNSDRENYVFNGYEIAFDGKGCWSFNNDFARNIIIFAVGNSSLCHTENLKNKFLISGKGDTFLTNSSLDAPERKI